MRDLLAVLIGLAFTWAIASSITAQGTVTVSGQVFLPDGRPFPRAAVELCQDLESTCLRAAPSTDGRFEFSPSSGSYAITVFDPRSARWLLYLEGGDGNHSWDSDVYTPIEVDLTDVSGIEITLPAPKEVSGVVRRSDGTLLPEVVIRLCALRFGECRRDSTDSNGRFSVVLPQNDYWLVVLAPDGSALGVYHPDAPGQLSEDQDNRGTLALRGAPLSGIVLTLPARFDELLHIVGGRLRDSSGTPISGVFVRLCRIANQICSSGPTDADGNFQVALFADSPEYELRIESNGISGYYSATSPGSFSESEAQKTVLTLETGSISGIEISISLPERVAGRLLNATGSPMSNTTVHVCREVPDPYCVTTETNLDGRFAIDAPSGDHYVAFTIESNERWYYHAGSEGRLISTGRRPERTFITVPSVEAIDIQVRIPQRDFVQILMTDTHQGAEHNASVEVTACREEWNFDSVLPWCLSPTRNQIIEPGVRRISSPLPDERFYFYFRFDGYAISANVGWYFDQDSPTGLTNDFTRATIFSADNPPPPTLSVSLPDLPRTTPVTLRLRPGANLVGWPGGTISFADLARQLPSLRGAVSIPRHPDASVTAYAAGNPNAPDLAPNSLWWFYVAVDEPISIEIETPVDHHPYSSLGYMIEKGRSLLVWAGPQTATLQRATAGLGPLLTAPRLLHWNGTSTEYLDSGLVQQGDIIQIDSPQRFFAQLPFARQPFFVLQGPADDHWPHIQQRVADVQAFFWQEYGLLRNDLTVFYRTDLDDPRLSFIPDDQCGSAWIAITLVCAEPHDIAKMYARFLQRNMSYRLDSPGWLIEGAIEYAAARYTQQAQGRSGDPLASHRLAARNDTDEQRMLDELPTEFHDWGNDPAATRLAALAVDWLVRFRGDPDSLFDVFRRAAEHGFPSNPDHDDWQWALADAFGIRVGEFYERFADYRANGFQLDRE